MKKWQCDCRGLSDVIEISTYLTPVPEKSYRGLIKGEISNADPLNRQDSSFLRGYLKSISLLTSPPLVLSNLIKYRSFCHFL